MTKRKPKTPPTMRSMDTAPTDGTPIDLWSPHYGWLVGVWFDPAFESEGYGDGWVTGCPRPFTGWREVTI